GRRARVSGLPRRIPASVELRSRPSRCTVTAFSIASPVERLAGGELPVESHAPMAGYVQLPMLRFVRSRPRQGLQVAPPLLRPDYQIVRLMRDREIGRGHGVQAAARAQVQQVSCPLIPRKPFQPATGRDPISPRARQRSALSAHCLSVLRGWARSEPWPPRAPSRPSGPQPVPASL